MSKLIDQTEAEHKQSGSVERGVMCGHCKDCKHRNEERYCGNEEKIDENYGQGRGDNDDKMIYSYSEGGGFKVGDNFGCIHFERKNT
ncbi:hypothetical protein KAR91_36705 [Candidatus Pacearchaeota archaeon]|nr:hypothetical protein [Candidatus Pacearchaeota archaeon]